jgi:siroheme synthase
VSDDILRLAHGGARMVYVGKQAGFHTRSQEQIHELLCEFASAGHKVGQATLRAVSFTSLRCVNPEL